MKTTPLNLTLTVMAQGARKEKLWVDGLRVSLPTWSNIHVQSGRNTEEFGQILFLDCSLHDLESILEKVDRRERAIFLVVEQENATLDLLSKDILDLLSEGRVDDIVVAPFRPLEVFGKIKQYEHILMWKEVSSMNSSLSDIIRNLQDDFKLAERLQKAKLPRRFPEVKGFNISSRYLVGMRSGGDYFDLAESKDNSHLTWVLSDSSSYGLSSAVLSVLMRATLKLSTDELKEKGSVPKVLGKIQEDLLLTLGEKDHLSLFFGVISRETQTLRFLNRGNSSVFFAMPGGGFEILPQQGPPLTRQMDTHVGEESEIQLVPGCRIALVSSGFSEILGGVQEVRDLFDYFRDSEILDSLNELVFRVKSKLKNTNDMPTRDCSVLIIEVDSRILRLSK